MEEIARQLKVQRQNKSKYRLLVLCIEASLYTLGLRRTQQVLNRFCKEKPGRSALSLDHLMTSFNQIKDSPFLKGKCLSQSLALQYILRQNGYSADLKIGAKKDDKKGIALHAWLEMEKQLLTDHRFVVSQYTSLLHYKS